MPDDALAHVHPGLRLVLVPAPFCQKAGREGEIGVLTDILIVDRAIDRLDRGIDRRRPRRRVERGQVDVEGDRQRVARLRESSPPPPRISSDRKVAAPSASVSRLFILIMLPSTLPVTFPSYHERRCSATRSNSQTPAIVVRHTLGFANVPHGPIIHAVSYSVLSAKSMSSPCALLEKSVFKGSSRAEPI